VMPRDDRAAALARRDRISSGIRSQQERARDLLGRATDDDVKAAAARTLHDLDALHVRFRDTEVAPDETERWLSFIHAQLAVAMWELDLAERELTVIHPGPRR
jgi:hypothetical protein